MSTLTASKVVVSLNKSQVALIKLAAEVAPKRPTKKVLSSVKLSVVGGTLLAFATDLDKWVALTIAENVAPRDENFSILIDRDVIRQIKSPTGKGVVEVEITDDRLFVSGLMTRASGDVEAFPLTPVFGPTQHATMGASYLSDFATVAGSASKLEFRPLLLAVYHTADKLIATDNLRLAEFAQSNVSWDAPVKVPASVAKLLTKTFATDTSVTMSNNDTHVQYTNGTHTITVRQIDGTYPDTSRLMPHSWKTEGTVGHDWIDAHKNALNVAKSNKDGMAKLDVLEDKCILSAKSAESIYEVELAYSGTGDDVTIAYNPQYMIDALSQVGDDATIAFNGPNQPMLLTSVDGRHKALVSPILQR